MKILGLSLGHDTNFSLIADGKVVAIMEAERYFRQKRYKLHCIALQEGKQRSGFQYTDIKELESFLDRIAEKWGKNYDYIAVQNQGRKIEYDNLIFLLNKHNYKYKDSFHIDHHLSHASLAFYTSPFSQALILSYDGTGNDGYTVLFEADGDKGIEYLYKNDLMFGRNYNNLGYIIGVEPDVAGSTAGKTMGLTAYGEFIEEWALHCRDYILKYRKFPSIGLQGLNDYGKGHLVNSVGLNNIPELKKFSKIIINKRPPSGLKANIIKFFKRELLRKVLELPDVNSKLSQNLVHTFQRVWTNEVLSILNNYKDVSSDLCVVGGCALNGIANYAIEEKKMFKRTHFVPNPSDCGLSAGASLYVYYKYGKHKFRGYPEYFSPYLGDELFDIGQLGKFKDYYSHRTLNPEEVPRILAKCIYKNFIVGVIRGRYEIGPRALGNRSILCNPLNKDMRDILNRKVKHREWYRPFAPVVTAEDAQKYFTNKSDIPYMSVICYTKREYRKKLPSITHVDGSARLQTIKKEHNSFLYETLKKFNLCN